LSKTLGAREVFAQFPENTGTYLALGSLTDHPIDRKPL